MKYHRIYVIQKLQKMFIDMAYILLPGKKMPSTFYSWLFAVINERSLLLKMNLTAFERINILLWFYVIDVKRGTSGRDYWRRMSHVLYANEPAVREEGSAQRLCGLKMADGESSLGAAFSGASEMEEPAAKRSKISPLTNHGVKVANLKQTSCVAGAAESLEAAVNCAQPAEKEAKPVMAVEQAPAALGGDNNGLGLLVSEPHKPVVKLDDSAVFGTTEEAAGKETGRHLTTLSVFMGLKVSRQCLFDQLNRRVCNRK